MWCVPLFTLVHKQQKVLLYEVFFYISRGYIYVREEKGGRGSMGVVAQ